MPTLTKLLSLLLFAAFAFLAAQRYVLLFDEPQTIRTAPGPWMAAIGGFVGWTFVGGRIGPGLLQAVWIGVQGVAVTIFWGLVAFGIGQVVARSYARHYDGVTDALVGWFEIAIEHLGRVTGSTDFMVFLGIGGAVCGLLGGMFFRWAENRRMR